MGVRVSYKLTGAGWAECSLDIDGQVIILTASYLSHALESLLQGTIAILEGDPKAKASFDEEPGEYRWLFTRINEQQIRIKILWFEDIQSNESDEDGQTIFEAMCRLRTFAGAVLAASQEVLSDHSLAGYKSKWCMHEFPITTQNALKQLLAQGRKLKPNHTI